MSQTIFLSAFAPLPSTLTLSVPKDATASALLAQVAATHRLDGSELSSCRLSTLSGRRLLPSSLVSDVADVSSAHPLTLTLRSLTLGGKGGFGSMLRAQGGKMSSSKRGQENTDSCRDLNGRRLSTMKQAQALAAYLESKPEREKALDERQRRKFAKLERMLGRRPRDQGEIEEAARRMEEAGDGFEEEDEEGSPEAAGENKGEGSSRGAAASSSASGPSSSARGTTTTTTATGTKRERIEDHTFVEESREIVEGVRSAVAAAMMKKRKLAKKSTAPGAKKSAGGVAAATSTAAEEGKGKAVAA